MEPNLFWIPFCDQTAITVVNLFNDLLQTQCFYLIMWALLKKVVPHQYSQVWCRHHIQAPVQQGYLYYILLNTILKPTAGEHAKVFTLTVKIMVTMTMIQDGGHGRFALSAASV